MALAPYIVPLYALALLGTIYGVSHFYPVKEYWSFVLWLLGGSLGFHVALTVYALKQKQPDLRAAGILLSAVLIFLGNSLSIVFMLGVLFPRTVSWDSFVRHSGRETVTALRQLSQGGLTVWRAAAHVPSH